MLFPVINAWIVNKVTSGSQAPILTLRSATALHRGKLEDGEWEPSSYSWASFYRRPSGPVNSLEWNSIPRQYAKICINYLFLLTSALYYLTLCSNWQKHLGVGKMSMSSSSASLMSCFSLSIVFMFLLLQLEAETHAAHFIKPLDSLAG